MMVRIDEKAKESITITRGTLWFIGTVITTVPVLLVVVVYVITVAMGYQGTVSRVADIENRVKEMEMTMKEVTALKITASQVQADVKQIRESQSASDAERKDMSKNIADIRILLASRQMSQ